MKEILLHKLHRYAGIAVAPFLVIQTISGLLLGFGFFRRPGGGTGERILPGSLDDILVKVHFKAGWLGDAYHLLLGAGIIWIALSGWTLYLRGRSRRKNAGTLNMRPAGDDTVKRDR
ncbi:MAG TPA: hypothetical protein VI298_03125 [Geobacteraceae bacterium]